jgi:hypothetical protein
MATPITLKIFRGNELVRTEQFTREIIKIGRLASAHLVLDDEKVSRIHSVIEVAPDGAISIIDMGSAEGTFVNGKKVSRGALRAGDQITLGGMRLVLEGAEAAPAAVAAPAAPAPAPVNRAVSVPAAAAPRPAGAGKNGHTAHAATRPAATPEPHTPARPSTGSGRADPPVSAAPAEAPPAPAPAPARRAPRSRRIALQPAESALEDLTHAADLGVELRLLWGETLLQAVTFVRPKAAVLVGKGPRCAIQVEGLPEDQFPMLRWDGLEYRFAFGKGMTGVVQDRAGRTAFGELVRSRKATSDEKVPGAFWIPVPRAGAVRADLGAHLAIEARPRQPEKVKPAPWWERINYQFLNLFLIFFFLGTAFVIAANNFPYDTDVSADDLFKNPSRMAKFIIKAPEVVKPPPSPDKGLAAEEKSDAGGEAAEKHKGEEGQMGKKDAPKTNGRSAPRAIDPNAKDIVKHSGLLSALGRGGGGLSTVLGGGGLGGDLKGAVGNMFGPVVGDSYGLGGLGIRGSGSGGGGAGETIGIGAPGTKGRGGGLGGGSGYGAGAGNLGKKGDREVKVETGNATVLGSIDKELIRKVIQEHASQIRYCYEQELALNPRLQGKVSIRWIIEADGSATAAEVDGGATTLENGKIHECMMSRIQSWQFPKPKGGGQAVITYPWILRASGTE